jgi:hypothetical protein
MKASRLGAVLELNDSQCSVLLLMVMGVARQPIPIATICKAKDE